MSLPLVVNVCGDLRQKQSVSCDLWHDVILTLYGRSKSTFFPGNRVCFFFFYSMVEMSFSFVYFFYFLFFLVNFRSAKIMVFLKNQKNIAHSIFLVDWQVNNFLRFEKFFLKKVSNFKGFSGFSKRFEFIGKIAPFEVKYPVW